MIDYSNAKNILVGAIFRGWDRAIFRGCNAVNTAIHRAIFRGWYGVFHRAIFRGFIKVTIPCMWILAARFVFVMLADYSK